MGDIMSGALIAASREKVDFGKSIIADISIFGQLPKHVPYAAYTDAHLMVIREQWDKKWSIQVVPTKPLGISPLTLSYSWTQFLEVLLGITGPIKDNEGRVCVFVFGPKVAREDVEAFGAGSLVNPVGGMGIHVIRITSVIYQ